MQNLWKIRILNTRHKDAEVIIGQPMVLGSEEEHVDLVINEDYISPKLVEILPGESGVTLKSLSDNVTIRVNGIDLEEGKNAPMQLPIAVGQLLVAVAPAGQAWADGINEKHILDSDETPNPNKPKQQLSNQGGFRSRNKVAIASGFVILMAALAAQLSNNTSEAYDTSIDSASNTATNNLNLTPMEKLKTERMIADNKPSFNFNQFPMVTIRHHQDTIIASGYVVNQQEVSDLLQSLNALEKTYEFRVQNMEDIRSAALLILANLNLSPDSLEIGDTPGSLRAVIDGKNIPAWRRAETLLKKDINGLLSWKLHIPKPILPMEQLEMLIAETALNGKITLRDKGDQINMIARLNSGQAQMLNNVVSQFKSRVGDYPMLVQITPSLQKKAPSLEDLGIRAVRSGGSPYVTLNDGKRYLPGSRLPNGNSLTDIEEGLIKVTSEDKSFSIRYDIDPTLGKLIPRVANKGN